MPSGKHFATWIDRQKGIQYDVLELPVTYHKQMKDHMYKMVCLGWTLDLLCSFGLTKEHRRLYIRYKKSV